LRIIKDRGGLHVKRAGHRPVGVPGYLETVIAETAVTELAIAETRRS
jgi:hypothetical protein